MYLPNISALHCASSCNVKPARRTKTLPPSHELRHGRGFNRSGTDVMLSGAGNKAILTDQTMAASVKAVRQAAKNVF